MWHHVGVVTVYDVMWHHVDLVTIGDIKGHHLGLVYDITGHHITGHDI